MKKFILFFLLLLAVVIGGCGKGENYTVQVLLAEGEGYTILSENPMTVQAGDDAVFSVALEEGWHFASSDGGSVWSDGTLTLADVYYPATIHMTASDSDKKILLLVDRVGDGKGKISYSNSESWLYPGTVIEATATVEEGSYFGGWSVGYSLEKGGELYSMDTKIQYTVPTNIRSYLYANFYKIVPEDVPDAEGDNLKGPTRVYSTYGIQGNESTHMIAYDVNGGRIVGYDTKVFYDEVSTAVFAFPNTLPEMGYFAKEGHLLLEYNTKPDGSGTPIPCGGKFVPEGDSTTLYCIWTPVTEESFFTVSNFGDGVAITGYSGDHETLVIPAYIGGRPVRRIKKGAITADTYKTLVLPNTLEEVENGAFTNSSAMETLFMYDTVKKIYDRAFSDLSGFKNLRLVAAMEPRWSMKDDPSYVRKWERLLRVAETDAKKLVVMSGSSSFYGLDTPLLEELLDEEYAVINFGNLAEAQVTFFMDAVADFLDEDDIIVHAPETGYDGVMGYADFFWWIYRVIEYNYDMLYHVDDMSLYRGVFDAFTEANTYRYNMPPKDYDIFVSYMDEYGDHCGKKPNINKSDIYFGKKIDLNIIYEDWIDNLNVMYDRVIRETGCRIIMSFAPFNYNALSQNSRDEASREIFMERITALVDIPVISHIWDYMLPGHLMYNSDYHPTDEGCERRTEQLAKDLKAYLAKEAKK